MPDHDLSQAIERHRASLARFLDTDFREAVASGDAERLNTASKALQREADAASSLVRQLRLAIEARERDARPNGLEEKARRNAAILSEVESGDARSTVARRHRVSCAYVATLIAGTDRRREKAALVEQAKTASDNDEDPIGSLPLRPGTLAFFRWPLKEPASRYRTVGDLRRASDADLLLIDGLGPRRMMEVRPSSRAAPARPPRAPAAPAPRPPRRSRASPPGPRPRPCAG